MSDEANRRQHARIEQKGYIKVVIESAPDAPNLEGQIFRCTTRDLSSKGIQIVTHSIVPAGTIVRLHVTFTEPNAEFEHLARVAWTCSSSDDVVQHFKVGLQLVSTKGEDDHEWADLLNARLLGSRQSPAI